MTCKTSPNFKTCFTFNTYMPIMQIFCGSLTYSSSELRRNYSQALLCVKPTAAVAGHTADRSSDTVDAQPSSHVLSTARSARHRAVVSAVPAAATWMYSPQSPVALSSDCAQFLARPAASNRA